MSRRYDVARSVLALLAGLVAALGAYAAFGDPGHIGRYQVGAYFGLVATVALLLALLPGGPRWSSRRRTIASIVATIALVAAFPVGFTNIIFGCGLCGRDTGLAPLLGIAHRTWIWLALALVPLLLGASGFLAMRGETHDAPEA